MEKALRKKSTILVVDDSQTNRVILTQFLEEEYKIICASSGEKGLEYAQKEHVDLILLDIMMPEIDGFEVCHTLKSQSSTENIPVIFVTANLDEDSIERAYDVGGVDYITKPFKARELKSRVKMHLEMRQLIEHLEFIATHDEMTGIYNRRKFFSEALDAFENITQNLYAIMIDIDKFKNINDTYGHSFGDKVIKLVAKTIASNLLDGAIFGRIGGEEFAIVCYSDTRDALIENVEKIRSAIEAEHILSDNGEMIQFTISEGIAVSYSETPSLDALLKKADDALYEAKGSGRNKAIFRP